MLRKYWTLTGDIGSVGHTVTAGNGIDTRLLGAEIVTSVGLLKKLFDNKWIKMPANTRNNNGTNIQKHFQLK